MTVSKPDYSIPIKKEDSKQLSSFLKHPKEPLKSDISPSKNDLRIEFTKSLSSSSL